MRVISTRGKEKIGGDGAAMSGGPGRSDAADPADPRDADAGANMLRKVIF